MSVNYYKGVYWTLRKWAENPKQTKREIGVWNHWKTDDPGNDKPLTLEEVKEMKQILRKSRGKPGYTRYKKYDNVSDWYKEERGGFPVQTAHAISELQKESGLDFQ